MNFRSNRFRKLVGKLGLPHPSKVEHRVVLWKRSNRVRHEIVEFKSSCVFFTNLVLFFFNRTPRRNSGPLPSCCRLRPYCTPARRSASWKGATRTSFCNRTKVTYFYRYRVCRRERTPAVSRSVRVQVTSGRGEITLRTRKHRTNALDFFTSFV